MKLDWKHYLIFAGMVIATIAVVRLVKSWVPIPASIAAYLP